MAVVYNPKIVTNGLAMCLDAGNSNKSARGFKNLLNLSTWTLGTGSVTGFNQNGTTAENQRILDTGPFGSALVWDTPSNDATNDADGGWETSTITIDPTKTHRFSVWMRRKTIGSGSSYLGPHSNWGAVAGQYILNRSNSAENQNPYFYAGTWWGNANDWYLVVGHVYATGSGSGSMHPDSGIYNTSGTKVASTQADFMWAATNTSTFHRSYLYYSTDTTTNQQWYQPRIDVVDGTEPTIAELIAGVGSKWYDVSGSNHGTILNSAALYNSAGYMNFDGVDDYVDCGTSIQLADNFTLEAWHKNINTGCVLDQGAVGTDPNGCLEWTNRGLTIALNNIEGASATGTFSDTTRWNHVACSFSGGTVKFYINGVFDSTRTMTSTSFTPSGILKVGRRALNTTAIMSGQLGAVRVYNKVLSDAEVSQNFDALRGRFGI